MSKIIDKRKRSREDDELCESTPLSKRINNLHLTNFEETDAQIPKVAMERVPHEMPSYDPAIQLSNQLEMLNSGSSPNGINNLPEQHFYNPELSESQNPFYYVKNKLLHDLHLERIKRCTL